MVSHIHEALPEASDSTEKTGDEDRASTSKPVVEGSSEPTAYEGTAHVGCAVY